MKRAWFLVVFAAMAILLSGAGSSDPLVLAQPQLGHGNRWFDPVDQQGDLINDTGCPWSADDDMWSASRGSLEPGASASVSQCLILDNSSLLLRIEATGGKLPPGASNFAVQITVEYSVPGYGDHWYRVTDNEPLLYTSGIKKHGTVSRSRLCAYAGYWVQTDLPPIGSNGGVGVPAVVTFTITNLEDTVETFNVTVELSGWKNNWPWWQEELCDPGDRSPFNFGHFDDGTTFPGGEPAWPFIYWRPGNNLEMQ